MAKYSFTDLGLPEVPLLTKGEAELDLRYLYFAVQNLAQAVGQQLGLDEPLSGYSANPAYTIGASKRRLFVVASEAIDYGELVHIFDNAGTMSARLADATDATKPCYGISNTVGTVALGGIVEVVLPNAYVDSVGGLTAGVTYYLTTTPGTASNTAPAAAGNIVQPIGFAVASAGLFFNPSLGFTVV